MKKIRELIKKIRGLIESIYSFEPFPMRIDTQSIGIGIARVTSDTGESSLFHIYWSWGDWHEVYIDLFYYEVFKYNGYK